MIVALAIVGFVVIGLAIGLIVTATAPIGYQDKAGFHYGRPDGRHEEDAPLAMPHPKLA